MRTKEPSIPYERQETVRQNIISLLKEHPLPAIEISADVRVSEKEVYEHLEHIRKTTHKRELHLSITPAECKKCGFVFRKRQRLRKPGKCPLCRGESIAEPLFSIKK